MKKIAPYIVCTLFACQAMTQSNFGDSIARSRISLTKNAMITLGSWALANIGTGFIVASETSGEPRYFWLMNGYWNFINLALAVPGYLGAIRASTQHLGFADNLASQFAIEKLYVFNIGLDLAYIAGGFYLGSKGSSEKNTMKNEQLNGYGNSIALQGGFLLVMDAVMFILHHKNSRLMKSHLYQLELNTGPGGLGLLYKF